MTELIAAVNSLTPLGLAGLSVIVIILQLKSKKGVANIADNHLHGLPDMAATLTRIEAKLDSMNDNIVYVRARINGQSH